MRSWKLWHSAEIGITIVLLLKAVSAQSFDDESLTQDRDSLQDQSSSRNEGSRQNVGFSREDGAEGNQLVAEYSQCDVRKELKTPIDFGPQQINYGNVTPSLMVSKLFEPGGPCSGIPECDSTPYANLTTWIVTPVKHGNSILKPYTLNVTILTSRFDTPQQQAAIMYEARQAFVAAEKTEMISWNDWNPRLQSPGPNPVSGEHNETWTSNEMSIDMFDNVTPCASLHLNITVEGEAIDPSDGECSQSSWISNLGLDMIKGFVGGNVPEPLQGLSSHVVDSVVGSCG